VRDEEYRVSGKLDTLVRTGAGEGPIEFKSIDSRSYSYGDLPKYAHQYQESMYLVFGPYKEGLICYMGKQDGRFEKYRIKWTPELDEFIKADLRKLDGYLKDYREHGKLPPALDAPKSDWRIRYCEYKGSGSCCGDDPVDVAQAADRAREPDPPHGKPPELPGLLRLGTLELEAPRA
jgi:hypothetical protein